MKSIDFVAVDEASIVSGLIDEIVSVCGEIHVAEYRLLELIRMLGVLARTRQRVQYGFRPLIVRPHLSIHAL